MAINIQIEDYSEEFLRELAVRAPIALEECGLVAEGYAKRLCPVDTGLLRNSITHAAGGKPPAISSYTDNPKIQHGEYTGSAPPDSNGEYSMYIGTNVEYAPYVEVGTARTRAQPFIKPSVADHVDRYKRIIEKRLKG